MRINTAIFGTGFMGKLHTESVRRLGNVEVVGVAGSSQERARAFADQVGIATATADYRELLARPDIQAVHICTPNEMHYQMVKDSFAAGKHVLCEKPLATSVAEGKELAALASKSGLVHCTFYNVRAYPQVRNMRAMVEAGDLGEIRVVQGTYSQDWLFYDTDWNWRVEAGPSRTFADIGTHWCDLAEFVTGLRFTSVCAELATFHKTRKKPKGSVETFSGKLASGSDTTDVAVDTEDFVGMMFRMGAARGVMTASQVNVGRKNRVFLEIFGSKRGVAWNAEAPDELWIGERNAPNGIMIKDPSLMKENARGFADLPGGHSEGFDDTFKQTIRRFYAKVADPAATIEYPQFQDGVRQLEIIDAVLASSRERRWVDLV
jgi:predicted dehydrogenase